MGSRKLTPAIGYLGRTERGGLLVDDMTGVPRH